MIQKIVNWIKGLSTTTGVVLLCLAGLFYVISFAQFGLGYGVGVKAAVWTATFGMAKACQYSGLLIVGKEGVTKMLRKIRKRKVSA